MEPKEKAEELMRRFSVHSHCSSVSKNGEFEKMNEAIHLASTKQCAYICCDTHLYSESDSPFSTMKEWKENHKYWMQVKQQVNQYKP